MLTLFPTNQMINDLGTRTSNLSLQKVYPWSPNLFLALPSGAKESKLDLPSL